MKKRYNRKIVDYNVCGSEAQRSVRGVVHEKSVFSVCVCVCVCLCSTVVLHFYAYIYGLCETMVRIVEY